MSKYFLLVLLFIYSLFAEVYENQYKTQELNIFMDGEFKEILRFDMLCFNEGKLSEDNHTHYEYILSTIKDYKEKFKNIKIQIIGHANEPTDNYYEKLVDSDTYANVIQKKFRYSLDTNKSKNLSRDYAKNIKESFVKDMIDKDIIVLEYRAGKDKAFSDVTIRGRNLSNRVMVTIYVLVDKEIDSDKDGIFDKYDKCPESLLPYEVDKNGCSLDIDNDDVYDYKDKCLNTPRDISVDKNGCSINFENTNKDLYNE